MRYQSRRDAIILDSISLIIPIPKGWHDWRGPYDTPSGLDNIDYISIIIALLRSLAGKS